MPDFAVPAPQKVAVGKDRASAAFVILARNDELAELRRVIRQLEDRFNRRYNYPYVLLNDKPFTDIFKEQVSALVSGNVSFGTLPEEMWSYPEWIDQERAKRMRKEMGDAGVMYGGSESYRHMCRFESGWFFRHPLVRMYDYYWRVEPDVQFLCDIPYDPFVFVRDNDIKYSFTIALWELASTIPTLWSTTLEFMKDYSHMIPKNNFFNWLSDDDGRTYNMCHFWSNFEIASVKWLNSPEYLAYFSYLDKAGGFFYERWGDAPVHSIAAAMLLDPKQVHFFEDIGYMHDPFFNCPSIDLQREKKFTCHCNPGKSFHLHAPKCTMDFLSIQTTGKKDDGTFTTDKMHRKEQSLEQLIDNSNNKPKRFEEDLDNMPL
ncbi:glycosyl transferase [Ramicandelaber brevisporus]|nr:glycosyl transferase [Ramicandelaber brevisporus]